MSLWTPVRPPITIRTCHIKNYNLPLVVTMSSHTMCGHFLCMDQCYKIEKNQTFTKLELTLSKKWTDHLCWALDNGDILLLGGGYYPQSTELVKADGLSSAPSFSLKHRT